MPTSETGRPNSAPPRVAGFTLLEVMMVVAIIGVMLVVVRVSLPDSAADTLKLEATRFVATLNDCRDTAVLSGSPSGIRIAAGGYGLERYQRVWQTPAGLGAAARRVLPDHVQLVVALERGARVTDAPAVVCLPSGETRLAQLVLSHRRARGFYRFHDDEDGEFVAEWVAPPT